VKSRILAAALLATLCGFPLGAQTSSEPSFGEVVEVTVVNVDVYVTDKDGNRVTGLKKEDFVVLEDGKPVQITNFEAVQGRAAPAGSAAPRVPAAPAVPEGTAPPANREAGLSLVVFVDNLHLRPDNRTRALEQIRKFLAANVRPGDRVMLVSHDLGLRTRQAFTDDPAALDSALKEIEGLPAFGVQAGTSRNEALRTALTLYGLEGCAEDVADPIEAYAQQMRNEALQTVGALTLTVNSLSGIPGRKAVLYVSDGVPVTPGEELFQALYELCSGGAERAGVSVGYLGDKIGGGDAPGNGDSGSTNVAGTAETATGAGYSAPQALLDAQSFSLVSQFADLAAHANAHRVTFYTLQASGLSAHGPAGDGGLGAERILQLMTVRQAQTANHQGSLTAMAADTGGRAILDVNDFLPELARMREDFSNYYSLGYNPSQLGQGKQHRLEVKVKRPGLRVRYRHSYRDKPLMERMVDRTLAALLHGLEDNPLDIAVNIGDQTPGEDGKFSVPVQLKIPIFKLALINRDETYQGKLRLLVATQDAKGANSPVRQVEVPLNIPRKEVLNAMGQHYLYTLTLRMPPGGQRVAVTVHDQVSASTSYLSRSVTVGQAAGQAADKSNGR
jgi:VWFA-related protein